MTKQMAKFLGLTLLLAAVSASAQITSTIKVKVPFPFVTSEKSWPAADYRVDITPENGILTLRSADATPATMLTSADERSADGKAHLLFQCSGDQWVLKEVVLDGMGRTLPLGKSEKGTAKVDPSCQETIVAGAQLPKER